MRVWVKHPGSRLAQFLKSQLITDFSVMLYRKCSAGLTLENLYLTKCPIRRAYHFAAHVHQKQREGSKGGGQRVHV